jgi:NAD(P)-dependent dehydrogenase (short-subunit alcohol dehydrogenase family)
VGFLEERADLDGRAGVIVGGGGGLGQACAADLGRCGVRLALCDRDEKGLSETAAAITEAGGTVTTAVLDARDPEALAAFFVKADEAFGGHLDVLVNVVGGTFRQSFAESNPKGWDALMRTNFVWLLSSIQLALPRLAAAGGGSIINLTSIEAHRAAPGYAVYAAMKAAVTSLTRTLAVELAPQNIRVNTIAPDYVPTAPLESLAMSAPEFRHLRHSIGIPMGRAGTYADVGGCAIFLASKLSAYVTGMALHPDGGAIASSGWMNWPGTGFTNNPPDEVLTKLLHPGS